MSDDADLREENARLRAQLDAARTQADQWRQVAEERRVTLERFRQHPAVRIVFRIAEIILPVVRRLRHRAAPAQRAVREVRRRGRALSVVPAALTAAGRERALRQQLAQLPDAPPFERSVSIVILTRDGHGRLAVLLPALRRTLPDGVELVVVDNGSGGETRAFLEQQPDVTVVRNEANESFSVANDRGAAATSAELLLFLNDDVEPLVAGWLERMAAALGREGAAAAGAQLVYPARGLLENRHPPLTVQHRGIELVPTDGAPSARNVHGGAPDPRGDPRAVPAVTAACLLVEREAYDAVGGFDERYRFGAEDVDLCLRLRQAGHDIAYVPGAVLFHHEGATRHEGDRETTHARQAANWRAFEERFGPWLRREVELDRLHAIGELTSRPYHLAITITRELEGAGYGDLFTARGLAAELRGLGWQVSFLERYRDAWYDVPDDVDAVLVLLDTFDVRRVRRPGLTTIAWIRNWGDRWAGHPWFDEYDLVLASSDRMARRIGSSTRHRPQVFPLATDPDRFRPLAEQRRGALLPLNHHGDDRGVPQLLDAVPDLRLVGANWDRLPEVADRWDGALDYDELADRYGRVELVVDQAAPHTRDDGSLNARVFDALAAGALVVTDQQQGAAELFGEGLPTYGDPSDLGGVIETLRHDPHTLQRVTQLRDRVLAEHTYARRARQLRDLLSARAEQATFALLIGAPEARVATRWGDSHLAEALGRELRARGHRTDVLTMDRWDSSVARGADVTLHLKGRGVAPARSSQTHVLWVISHPDEVTDEELEAADLVLAASPRLADHLRTRTGTQVETMLQATDHHRFAPRRGTAETIPVAFVGNSKFTERPIVRDALAAGLDLTIFGANWEKFVDPRLVAATYVPNAELPQLYSSISVLLNDHWDDMRRWGIASNRLFDALACGTVVVSDEVPGVNDLFDGAVVTYPVGDVEALRTAVDQALSRVDAAARGREAVLSAHTFAHRADQLLAHLAQLGVARFNVASDPSSLARTHRSHP